MVNVVSFENLLGQLPTGRRLVCFWSTDSPAALVTLHHLALLRRGQPNLQILAANLDAPQRWSTSTLPTLRAAGTTYPCVVIMPDAVPDVLARFGLDGQNKPLALVLLDRAGNLIQHLPASPQVDDLARAVTAATAPAKPRSASSYVICRVRLLNLASGRLLAEYAIYLPRSCLAPSAGENQQLPGRQPEVARLAHQITPNVPAGKRLAVAPFRNAAKGASESAYDKTGLWLARQLAEALENQHVSIASPQDVSASARRFGISLPSVELDPTQLSGLLGAHYILLGDFGPYQQ